MFTRRSFIKTATSVGALNAVKPIRTLSVQRRTSSDHFSVHPFIESHPEAVFVMKTYVDVKTNSAAKVNTGRLFANSVLLPVDKGGMPVTTTIPIKPNLTSSQTQNKNFSLEYGMGIVTDPFFVEGVIEGMKTLGLSGNQFFIREVNSPEDFEPRGYTAMAERTGAEIRDLSMDSRSIGKEFLQWVDIMDGVVHRKIPYLWPVNARNTFYLNIAKFKSHGTGMTLCCKNHQGAVANKYQRFCHANTALKDYHYKYLHPQALQNARKLYDLHLAKKIPYWDKLVPPGKENRLNQDLWCQRTLDSLSATNMGLCIIEGIYGREGCFLSGPNPPQNNDLGKKEARDYMTNVILFGKYPIMVDIIGHWLAGHEPGNFGFFHFAMDRGLSTLVDPRKIPVYLWSENSAVREPLETFRRTPIRADYIPKGKDRYYGQSPQEWFMYYEPFDYSTIDESVPVIADTPGVHVLDTIKPYPANPRIHFEYTIPSSEYVRLDIIDESGNRFNTLVNGYRHKGSHCASWIITNRPSGKYYLSFRYNDFSESREFVLKA